MNVWALVTVCLIFEMILVELHFDSLYLYLAYSFVLSIQIFLVYQIKTVHSVYVSAILIAAIIANLLVFIDFAPVSGPAFDYHSSIMIALTFLELLVLGFYTHGSRIVGDIIVHNPRFDLRRENNNSDMVAV